MSIKTQVLFELNNDDANRLNDLRARKLFIKYRYVFSSDILGFPVFSYFCFYVF